MPTSYTQDTRIAALSTPLGGDELVLTRFNGVEGMSEPFEYTVDALSKKKDINFDDAIGQNCTVALQMVGDGVRHYCGTLTATQTVDLGRNAEDDPGELYGYRLTLRPWIWLLTKRTNSQIYQNKAVPDIIADIFGKYGQLADFQNKCSKGYPQLEYCVQHRETDFAFVSRLMESWGISYHYEFGDKKQTLIMGDGTSAYGHVPGNSRDYISVSEMHGQDSEHLFQWEARRSFTAGKSTFNDYDFNKPSADMIAEVDNHANYEQSQLERYQHPGNYEDPSLGKTLSTVAINSERAEDSHFSGSGDCASLAPGMLMTLAKHPDSSQNAEYLVLRATHYFETEQYRSGNMTGSGPPYRGSYEFIKSDVPYTPPIVTPKPIISGPQTGKVVGKGEIDCDEFGRIIVHFHWNRASEGKPEGQTMRCRVAQLWAGSNWGGMFIPRVDMEVLVQFIDGDPDRPVVVGCLYNQDNKPPYTLADEKNLGGIKSNSTEGGGGYNELVFDDSKGKELIRAHAQHDLDTTVEHDETRTIHHDRVTQIDHDDVLTANHDILITAQHQIVLTVGQSTIVMDMTSITITSPTVSIQANAEFTSNAGATSSHSAGGVYSISAPLVKVN